MNQTVTGYFQQVLQLKDAKPGLICALQTFGDKLNPNVHLHVVATEGAFVGNTFYPWPLYEQDFTSMPRSKSRPTTKPSR